MRISVLQSPLSERPPGRRGGVLRYARSRRCAATRRPLDAAGGVDLMAHMPQPPQCATTEAVPNIRAKRNPQSCWTEGFG